MAKEFNTNAMSETETFILSESNIPRIRRYLSSLRSIYQEIHDPRDPRGKKFDLDYVLSLYTIGVLTHHTSCSSARSFIKENKDMFSAYFPEINTKGIPSEDCFCDCLAAVSKKQMELAFEKFVETYRDADKDRLKIDPVHKIQWEAIPGRHKRGEAKFRRIESTTTVKNHLAVDGKAKRAATDKKNNGKTPYIGGIYDAVEKQYVKQADIPNGKEEGEATVIREALSQMDLRETIITSDALHSNKETLQTIHERNGEFLLRVKKDSHKVQFALIKDVVQAAQEEEEREKRLKEAALNRGEEFNSKTESLSHSKKTEYYGGKYCEYDLSVVGVEAPLFADYSPYISHVALLKTRTYTILYDKEGKCIGEELEKEYECCFFISCGLSASVALDIIISHWGIESSHWILDNYLNEDRSTAKSGNQIFNRAVILRVAYNILQLLDKLLFINEESEENVPAQCDSDEDRKKTRRLTTMKKFNILQSWPFIAIILVLGRQENIYSKMGAVYLQRAQACMQLQSKQNNASPEYVSI